MIKFFDWSKGECSGKILGTCKKLFASKEVVVSERRNMAELAKETGLNPVSWGKV